MSEIEYPYGIDPGPDRQVCLKHFSDYAIEKFITENGFWSTCDYCQRTAKVVDLGQLAEFLIEAVQYFYSDPTNFASYNGREGGFLVSTFDTNDILFDIFELDIDLRRLDDDLREWFDSEAIWADESGYYGEGDQMLIYSWQALTNVAKEKLGQGIYNVVIDEYQGESVTIGHFLENLRKEIETLNLITILNDKSQIFRGRTHSEQIRLMQASDFASSPNPTQPNRMSRSGVSMFYGAFDPQTAAMEIIEENGPEYVSMAVFRPDSNLYLLDLTRMLTLPSRFDEKNRSRYFILDFLRQFAKDFSKPISRDGKQHVEYLPTQFMTQFFQKSEFLENRIDGIIYTSAKHSSGQCVVLFFDYMESLKNLWFEKIYYSAISVDNFDL